MTSVTNLSLASLFSTKDGTTSTTSQQTANPTLADVFATASGTKKASESKTNGNSYLLDLSESAKAYLQNLDGNGGSSASSTTSSTGGGIVLNREQQTKLNAILEKYKDKPYTNASFKQMQVDMADAGIGADSLAAQNQMRHLNPTLMLLNALNGGDGSVGTVGGSSDITAETKNFMKKVAERWKEISTTAQTTPATDPS
jgi:hypothetical protein